jgi:hypothetical protein
MSKMKAYYFKDKTTGRKRNTAIFATSASAARKKLKRPAPANAVVYAVRTPQTGEGAHGHWSRIRADGRTPQTSRLGHGRGFGPRR